MRFLAWSAKANSCFPCSAGTLSKFSFPKVAVGILLEGMEHLNPFQTVGFPFQWKRPGLLAVDCLHTIWAIVFSFVVVSILHHHHTLIAVATGDIILKRLIPLSIQLL